MNLIIDIGNTKAKLAVFSNSKILKFTSVNSSEVLSEELNLIKQYPNLNRGIISSVGGVKASDFKKLDKQLPLLKLDSNTPVPFTNLYRTPKTLGVDRIALVSAAASIYPEKNVLVIDAGTCITYDFLDRNNKYHGGAISPGVRSRYKSLNTLTANLPLLETRMPSDIIGKSTSSSIHSGVMFGVIKEIDGVIDEYKRNFGHLTVILTGGDSKRLSKRLKNSIFANSNFLLEGLNYILEFNREQ